MAHRMFEVAGVRTFNNDYENAEARNLKLSDNLAIAGATGAKESEDFPLLSPLT